MFLWFIQTEYNGIITFTANPPQTWALFCIALNCYYTMERAHTTGMYTVKEKKKVKLFLPR